MKRFTLIFALIACTLTAMATPGDTIALFNSKNYDDWTYTRDGYALTPQLILQHKVTLFISSQNNEYTLVSSTLDLNAVSKLRIEFDGYCQPSNGGFSPKLNSPTIELIDDDGNVVSSHYEKFSDKTAHRSFSCSLDVPSSSKPLRLRIAAWDANSDNALAVVAVVVTDDSFQRGDVNGDGNVNSGDVSELYKAILGGSNDIIYDLNNDGSVNTGDISELYRLILNS